LLPKHFALPLKLKPSLPVIFATAPSCAKLPRKIRRCAALEAILKDKIQAGDVIVIRYEGPAGGPGMREMLAPTSAVMGKGLGGKVAQLPRKIRRCESFLIGLSKDLMISCESA
jgi:hypothetical protein